MKFLIDFVDDATQEAIDGFLTDNECVIEKVFSHFDKTYLVSAATPPSYSAIVTSCTQEDGTHRIELLETVIDLPPVRSFSVTESDTDWWKYAVFAEVSDELDNRPSVDVYRKGRNHPIYLLDSGIDTSHEDFTGSNIRKLFSFNGDSSDSNGHGTALASLMVGATAGITDAEVIDVKVFHKGQPTLRSDIVAALDAVATDYHTNYPGVAAVINTSWGIARDTYIEEKILALIDLGIVVVAAAGNSGVPVGDVTPAGMPEVITIGSVGPDLLPSDFTNYTDSSVSVTAGENNHGALDVWAPGEHIRAANIHGGFSNIAGTSAAAAIFSAAAAYRLSESGLRYGSATPIWSNALADALENEYEETTTDIDLVRGSLLNRNNPVLFSRNAVTVTGKYEDCTTLLVSIMFSIKTPLNDSKDITGFVATAIMVGKGEPVYVKLFDRERFSQLQFGELPKGLSLDGAILSGQLDTDIPEGKAFHVLYIPVTYSDGETELTSNISIIHYDKSNLEEDTTPREQLSEFLKSEEASLVLYYIICDCNGCFDCGNGANVRCGPCANGKGARVYCGSTCWGCAPNTPGWKAGWTVTNG